MVLDSKETTVAFRCPECGSWVTGITGAFSLSADMMRLKCPCGGGEMDVLYGKDRKIRLTVPCFACPAPHSFTLSSQVFFTKDLFALSCPYSGVDICYIGDGEKIAQAEKEADEALGALFERAGYTDFFGEKKEEDEDFDASLFSDPQILEIVNFVIRDLDEAGEITCNCEKDEGLYSVDVTPEGVCVKCENCGAKAVIPVTSTLTAQAFLNCEHIDLH